LTDDFTRIPVLALPWLSEVRLYDETWEKIISGHGEFRKGLPAQRTALENAIANPTSIYVSATDPERAVVIVSHALTYLGAPVVVPVRRIAESASGRVVTAYFSARGYRGKLLWKAYNE
jgi:hypothetical protein